MTSTNSSRLWLWSAVLAIAVAAVYANSFHGVFHLDDTRSIVQNESLRTLTAPATLLLHPDNVTRPFVAYTFAIDYAIFGANPAGYHALNILIHLASTLLLFGILCRTLLAEKWTGQFESSATPLAFCIALIWSLHPLNTQAVTYIVQRMESMMGMFFMLALYCMIRGSETNANRSRWHLCATVAAVLGAGSKQVIVVLPFVALIYDRCFISGTFRAALKRAPALYIGLCASWLVVGVTLILTKSFFAAGLGMNNVTPFNYAYSQFVVIIHYIRLAFWPVGLCLDYDWKIERDLARILPCAALVLGLLGITAWQLRKNTAAGVCGAWFFLTLAPTSSIMPIADLAVEHRMYLALASVVAVTVISLFALARKLLAQSNEPTPLPLRAIVALSVVLGLVLGGATVSRNAVYADSIGMLNDVIAKRPENPRAYAALAMDALKKGDIQKATENVDKVVLLRPKLAETYYMKGLVQYAQRDLLGAIDSYETALSINPKASFGWSNLCDAWTARDKNNATIRGIANALKTRSNEARVHMDMGSALAAAARYDSAVLEFSTAWKIDPTNESAIMNWGKAFELLGRESDAITVYRTFLAQNPSRSGVANAWAWILATSPNEIIRNGKEAVTLAEHACAQTQNKHPLMLDTLAAAYAESGQFPKAIAAAESALALVPKNSTLANEIQAHLAKYKDGKPHHEAK
ncbi:MAG: tetratricopeptide repeat protein [Planctomycetota bacterium]